MSKNNGNGVIAPPARKLVGVDNKPLAFTAGIEQDSADTSADTSDKPYNPMTQQIVQGLRHLATNIENGTFPADFVLLLPKLTNGETSFMYLGDPIPTVMLEGVLHKVLTRMALQ